MNDADAADFLRGLAAMSRQMRSRVEDPAVTLDHAAELMDARDAALDDEPTNPRAPALRDEPTDPCALIIRECPNCGQAVPAAWTPPEG